MAKRTRQERREAALRGIENRKQALAAHATQAAPAPPPAEAPGAPSSSSRGGGDIPMDESGGGSPAPVEDVDESGGAPDGRAQGGDVVRLTLDEDEAEVAPHGDLEVGDTVVPVAEVVDESGGPHHGPLKAGSAVVPAAGSPASSVAPHGGAAILLAPAREAGKPAASPDASMEAGNSAGLPDPVPDPEVVRQARVEALLADRQGAPVGDPERIMALMAEVRLLPVGEGYAHCWSCAGTRTLPHPECTLGSPGSPAPLARENHPPGHPLDGQHTACQRCRSKGFRCDWHGRVPSYANRRGGPFLQEAYLELRLRGRRLNPAMSYGGFSAEDLSPALAAEYPLARAREEAEARANEGTRPARTAAGSPGRSPGSRLPRGQRGARAQAQGQLGFERPLQEHLAAVATYQNMRWGERHARVLEDLEEDADRYGEASEFLSSPDALEPRRVRRGAAAGSSRRRAAPEEPAERRVRARVNDPDAMDESE